MVGPLYHVEDSPDLDVSIVGYAEWNVGGDVWEELEGFNQLGYHQFY